jgi:hypothetical protein
MVDLVLYNVNTGEAFVALSNGGAFDVPRRFASGLPRHTDRFFQVELDDVNGDRRDDLLVFSRGPAGVAGAATALVALSTGTSFAYAAAPIWNPSWCAEQQTCLTGDINGDGRADLVAITQDFGTVFTSLSLGDRFGPNSVWHNFFCVRNEACAVGDVDGDRKADAILFKPMAMGVEKGNVLIARSTGAAFTDVRYGHGYFCIDAEQCLVGDVNGDRRTDIVLTKGWAMGWQQLEVLVSLSDGDRFINANPFLWASPAFFEGQTFGTLTLADVTGDGREDLVQYGSISANTVVNVFPVTDAPSLPTGPNPDDVRGGFSSVKLYNCHPNQNRLFYWNIDQTAGSATYTGLIDAMYSESGYCPDPNDEPETIDLADGHVHYIVAVDPEAIGCDGRNDPNVVGCVYNAYPFRGNATGPVCRWIVSAQPVTCVPGIGTASIPLSFGPTNGLLALRLVGVDFSVQESDMTGWLDNLYTPYPAIAATLLRLLEGRRLRQPVYMDVIAWNYENAPGATSPRTVDDVDVGRLKAAVLEGYNSRYGEAISAFDEIVR